MARWSHAPCLKYLTLGCNRGLSLCSSTHATLPGTGTREIGTDLHNFYQDDRAAALLLIGPSPSLFLPLDHNSPWLFFVLLDFRYLPSPHYLSLTRGDKANPSGPVALPFLFKHNLYWGGGSGEGLSYPPAAYTYCSKAHLSHERLRGAVKQVRVLPDLRLLPCVRILEEGRGSGHL